MGEVSCAPGQCWRVGEDPLMFNFKTNFSSGLRLDTWEEGYKNSNVLKNLSTKYVVRGFIRLIFEKKI